MRLTDLVQPAELSWACPLPTRRKPKPVDILFLLLIPVDEGHQHVAALAPISRSMRDENILRAIRKASSPAALYELLAATET